MMDPIGYLALKDAERRSKELIREAQQYSLIERARQYAETLNSARSSRSHNQKQR